MSRSFELTIVFVLVINVDCGMSRAAAQSDTYPRMAAMKGLPPILLFAVVVANWSGGTLAGKYND